MNPTISFLLVVCVEPRPRLPGVIFAVVKAVSAPDLKVWIVREEASIPCRTWPASHMAAPIVPSLLIWYFVTCPSQKGSPLMGWKDAS